uniref:CLIP-associating protein 1-A-like isoform X5 n=1 Tax=Myxine glutinosa TaxID=7769 RepID=UPI0035900983
MEESCMSLVQQKDVARRLRDGPALLELISGPSLDQDLESNGVEGLADGLVTWVASNNFKVSLLGLEALAVLVERLQENFKPQLVTVLPCLVDRLGDTKEQVRNAAKGLLIKIMDLVSQPQVVWERLQGGFKHRNFHTREGLCLCLDSTINRFGAQSLSLNKLVPHMCNLLGDANSQVREAAMVALTEVYRHVGERVRADLTRKGLPQARLTAVLARFDEVLHSGHMITGEDKSPEEEDSVDGNKGSSAATGSLRAPLVRSVPTMPAVLPRKPLHSAPVRTHNTGSSVSAREKAGGAVDEEDFIRNFEDAPTVQIYSSRDLEESLNKIRTVLSDDKHDWEQRVAALKRLRSLLIAGAADHDCFFQHLRLLDSAFKLSAKDLRSQVVREACVTLGHLSIVLGSRFDHGAEAIVPTLFNLVPNSVKIMSTSGVATIRIIVRHTHGPRLIPILTNNCTSKSVSVRRRCFEFVDLLLREWQVHTLEKHVGLLVETIKKGIHDADSEARTEARKCYWGLHGHFPSEAEAIYASLEPSYQKALQSQLRSSASVGSLPRSDQSTSSSQESLNRIAATKRPVTNTPMAKSCQVTTGNSKSTVSTPTSSSLQRSRSDIDINAAAVAKSRHGSVPGAGRLASAALPPGSYASLGVEARQNGRVRARRPGPGNVPLTNSPSQVASETRGRSRSKISQSQRSKSANPGGAGSRSGSPSRMLSVAPSGRYAGMSPRGLGTTQGSGMGLCSGLSTTYKPSRIPRSQGCSRETSPSRMSVASRHQSRSTSALPTSELSGLPERHNYGQVGRLSPGNVHGMRLLDSSSDVEAAVADALLLGDPRPKTKPRRRLEAYISVYSDEDANSDASSACSERSFSSRNGSATAYCRHAEDVAELLNRCASGSWAERKDGLQGLHSLLRSQRMLSRVELKRLCEIFTRMFADPHSKVFSMFLDTLLDFVSVYKSELQDWLYVLLTQLLKKTGAELLGSVHVKVQRALDVTRISFAYNQQFNILMRFIVDQTQTPNLKVKVAVLRYIESLAQQMDPADFVNSSETRLAVSRIITWNNEPKSSDVRKAAQAVLIALFELNTPECTMLLAALPKSYQEGTTKLLHSHLRGGNTISGSGGPRAGISRCSPGSSGLLTPPSLSSRGTLSPSLLDYDSENMNSDDIYSSLRGVSEAIQNLSFRSQEELAESLPARKEPNSSSRDSGIAASLPDVRGSGSSCGGDSPDGPVVGGRTALDNKTSSLLNTISPRSLGSGLRPPRDYNPLHYSDGIGLRDRQPLKETFLDDPPALVRAGSVEQTSLLDNVVRQLSVPGEPGEERRATLIELLKLAREDGLAEWQEHFKTILLRLTEHLSDGDAVSRTLALRVLREMVRNQPARFRNYAELTIVRSLEAHQDPHKEVVRAAEEVTLALANSIQPEQCLKVLCPIVQNAEHPVNLAAIKMQTKVMERVVPEALVQVLPDVVPGLLKGYDSTESSVRKASVFCLVAVHSAVGDELKPYLAQLTGSKMKLLNLYIRRAQCGTSGGANEPLGQI